MFDTAHVLRCHRDYSYVTNLNLGIQIAEKNGLSSDENQKSVECVLAKLQ